MSIERSLWCEPHWSRVAQDPTINGLAASMFVMEAVVADREFLRRCGLDTKTGAKADTAKMNEVMRELAPVCCHLGDDTMDGILLKARALSAEGRG